MRAYMAWTGDDPGDGAVLVLAPSARAAKMLAAPLLSEWGDGIWTDYRVRWMRHRPDYAALAAEATTPTVIESPAICPRCKRWGGELTANGECECVLFT